MMKKTIKTQAPIRELTANEIRLIGGGDAATDALDKLTNCMKTTKTKEQFKQCMK